MLVKVRISVVIIALSFLKLYAESVPFPSAKVLFEEIFHSGLIPSDTDFRIFRDYGHKPGKYNISFKYIYLVPKLLTFSIF